MVVDSKHLCRSKSLILADLKGVMPAKGQRIFYQSDILMFSILGRGCWLTAIV